MNSSERVISSSLRPLPTRTQQIYETNFHALRWIRTRNPSRQVAADLRLRTTRPPESAFQVSYCETYFSYQAYPRALIIHLNAHKIYEFYLNVINRSTFICIISGKLRRRIFIQPSLFQVRTAEMKHVLCVCVFIPNCQAANTIKSKR